MTILFDDTYTGPRWTYGLSSRPLSQFHVPDGFIIWSDRKHPDFLFGTVQYPRELSANEVSRFELVAVPNTP